MGVGPSSTVKVAILAVALIIIPIAAGSQSQYPPQAPYPTQQPAPPPAAPSQQMPPASQPQQPLEYAFRPDLTNPEYGECLRMEKNWQALWQRYAQAYQQVLMMRPNDPQYRQMALYAQGIKQQLDAAWNEFSGKCVYFPPPRR